MIGMNVVHSESRMLDLVHVVLELIGEVGEHHVRQKPVRDFGHECGLPVFLHSPKSSIDEGGR